IDGEPSGLEAWESDVPELTAATRDVVILLMDEYPNGEFLDSIGAQEASVVGWLDDSGFDTDGSIWSTYAFTELALPAFFLLQPALEAGDRVTESLRGELAGMAGGENPVVRSFNNAGYRTWMVESGWSGLRCMPTIDECIRR